MFNNNPFGNQRTLRPMGFPGMISMGAANYQEGFRPHSPKQYAGMRSSLPNVSANPLAASGLYSPKQAFRPNTPQSTYQGGMDNILSRQMYRNNQPEPARAAQPSPMDQMQGMVNRLRPNQDLMNNLNARMTQTLNRPVDRMRNDAAGVSNAINPAMLNPANPNSFVPSGQNSGGLLPRQNTQMARNVMMGQSPTADTSMRALNIPGMRMEGNRMVRMNPYESRGVMPNSMNQTQAALAYDNPDDFRVATGGKPMVPYAGRSVAANAPLEGSANLQPGQLTRADWGARAERQAMRRAYMGGGRSSAGFNQFMQNYLARKQGPANSMGVASVTGMGVSAASRGVMPNQSNAPAPQIPIAVPSQFMQKRGYWPDDVSNRFYN
jgi:hypothetical protein